jgi:hypothetical protein
MLIHDLLEGLAGLSRFGAELGGQIVVEGQCCSHSLMLSCQALGCQS